MNGLKTFLLVGALAVVSTSALPQSRNSTQDHAPGAAEPVAGTRLDGTKATTQRTVTIQEEQARKFRSAPPKLDASKFDVMTWSAGGQVERSPAPGNIVEAIKAMAPTAPAAAPVERSDPVKLDADAIEPISTGSGQQNRLMVGPDERVKIDKTTQYPFSAFVHLISEFPDSSTTGCSGTVVGLHHVLTAANCVFDWKMNAWPKSIAVYPGRNGDDGPFGGYYVVGLSVASGFSDAPKGTYDFDRMLYDLALLRFEEPIGDATGWLAFGYDDALPVFVGNLIGYPTDKDYTLWRSSCEIDPKQIEPNVLAHQCDVKGTGGAAIYQYTKDTGARTIYGVQVADSADTNYAVRITGPWFDWLVASRDGK